MKRFKMIMTVLVAVFALGLLTGCTSNVKPKLVEFIKPDVSEYFVYISNEDCAACKSIAPQVEQFSQRAKEDQNLIKFYKIDTKYVDKKINTEKDFGVKFTPTLIHVKDGKIISKETGAEKVIKLFEEQYGKLS